VSDSAFKALADPTRREILRLLAAGDLPAGELGARFDISQPAVSRHLAVLRSAGLVSARRDKQSMVYSLDTTVVQDVVRLLLDLAPRGKPRGGPR
jgi:ArsR family transcriptional regulator, arsenate/arsenite/antimonite-responsive transcriptional repressor